jgi:hypothetical protein
MVGAVALQALCRYRKRKALVKRLANVSYMTCRSGSRVRLVIMIHIRYDCKTARGCILHRFRVMLWIQHILVSLCALCLYEQMPSIIIVLY